VTAYSLEYHCSLVCPVMRSSEDCLSYVCVGVGNFKKCFKVNRWEQVKYVDAPLTISNT
jgi:hypothetical protein